MGAARQDDVREVAQVRVATKSKTFLFFTLNIKICRLKEANKQKTFMAAVKDLDFWVLRA